MNSILKWITKKFVVWRLRKAAKLIDSGVARFACQAVGQGTIVHTVFVDAFFAGSVALYGNAYVSSPWFYDHKHDDILEALTRHETSAYHAEVGEHRVFALLLLADAVDAGDIDIPND